MFKTDLLRSPSDEGSGGAPQAETAETTPENPAPASEEGSSVPTKTGSAFDWGDLDDDLKAYVGEKTPQEIAKEALAHRNAASQRPEQIEENLLKEKGYLAPPKEGDEGLDFFKQFAPEDTKAYSEVLPDKFGENATDDAKVFMTAAQGAGIDPRQFKAFVGGLEEAQQQAAEAATAEFSTTLQEAWGGDFEKNKTFADRAVKEIFTDGGEAFLSAMAIGANAESKLNAMNVFAQIGQYLGEGTGLPAGQSAPPSAQSEFEALQNMAIDAGGIRNLSSEQQSRYQELIKEVSK